MKSTERVEVRVILAAPVSRVWRAITTASEFGSWFGVALTSDFAPGKTVRATFSGELDEKSIVAHQTMVGLEPSKIRLPDENTDFCEVVRVEPKRHFSFQWIPYGIDAEADPKTESPTLVEFALEPSTEGTQLTIVESGFDRVPAHRRDRAFRMNQRGWMIQAQNLKRYVEAA